MEANDVPTVLEQQILEVLQNKQNLFELYCSVVEKLDELEKGIEHQKMLTEKIIQAVIELRSHQLSVKTERRPV